MAAAIAFLKGGNDDIFAAESDKRRNNAQMTLHHPGASLASAKLAVQQWQANAVALDEKKSEALKAGWHRARDSTAELVAVLVESDLLFLHFKVQLRTKAAEKLESFQNTFKYMVEHSFLQGHLAQAVEQDALLPVILSAVMYAVSTMEMYLNAFPNYEELQGFAVNLLALSQYLSALPDRLTSLDFQSMVVEAVVLTKFPLDPECSRAASEGGFASTDAMVMWDPNAATLASKILSGDSTRGAFFPCSNRVDPIDSSVGFHSFNPAHDHRSEGSFNHQADNRLCADNSPTEITAQCLEEDYVIKNVGRSVQAFRCTCDMITERGGGGMYQKVEWTCTTKHGNTQVKVEDLSHCTLKPGAVKKIFTASEAESNIAISNNIVDTNGRLGSTEKFITQLKDRVNLVHEHGMFCNTVEERGVRAGHNYLQLGSWRLAMINDAHFSISHLSGNTAMIWRSDATRHGGPRQDWGASTWAQGEVVDPTMDLSIYGIYFGNRFIQIGSWRFAEINAAHFTISHQNRNMASRCTIMLCIALCVETL